MLPRNRAEPNVDATRRTGQGTGLDSGSGEFRIDAVETFCSRAIGFPLRRGNCIAVHGRRDRRIETIDRLRGHVTTSANAVRFQLDALDAVKAPAVEGSEMASAEPRSLREGQTRVVRHNRASKQKNSKACSVLAVFACSERWPARTQGVLPATCQREPRSVRSRAVRVIGKTVANPARFRSPVAAAPILGPSLSELAGGLAESDGLSLNVKHGLRTDLTVTTFDV